MTSLTSYLESENYKRIPLTRNGIGHFEAAGMLNGHAVHVLIDTGAANTVINLSLAYLLKLDVALSEAIGGGAGGVNLEVYTVTNVDLRLGEVIPMASQYLAMDLAHVNVALAQKGTGPVDVILGVDVFEAQAAVIDYGSASLFLKMA